MNTNAQHANTTHVPAAFRWLRRCRRIIVVVVCAHWQCKHALCIVQINDTPTIIMHSQTHATRSKHPKMPYTLHLAYTQKTNTNTYKKWRISPFNRSSMPSLLFRWLWAMSIIHYEIIYDVFFNTDHVQTSPMMDSYRHTLCCLWYCWWSGSGHRIHPHKLTDPIPNNRHIFQYRSMNTNRSVSPSASRTCRKPRELRRFVSTNRQRFGNTVTYVSSRKTHMVRLWHRLARTCHITSEHRTHHIFSTVCSPNTV